MKLDRSKFNVIGIDRIKIYVKIMAVNTKINADLYSVATENANKYCEV